MSLSKEVVMSALGHVLQEPVEESEKQEDGKQDPDPVEHAHVGALVQVEPSVFEVVQERIGGPGDVSGRRVNPADPGIGKGDDHPEIADGIDEREQDVEDTDLVDGVRQDEVDHGKEGNDDVEADGRVFVQQADSADGDEDEVEETASHRDGDDGEETDHEGQSSAVPGLSEIAPDVGDEENDGRDQYQEIGDDREVAEDQTGTIQDGLNDRHDEGAYRKEEDDGFQGNREDEHVLGLGWTPGDFNHFFFPPSFHRRPWPACR